MENDNLLNEANLLFKQEKYKDLINLYESLQSLDNLDYRHFKILAVSYLQTFQYNEALKTFDECIKRYPRIEERDQLIVEPLYLFAHKLLKNRQYEDFEKARKLLLTFNPDYYFFRSMIWKLKSFRDMDRRGNFDNAITMINHVLEGEKYLRSDIERERERESWEEKCFDHLQRALEISGGLPFILEELGLFTLMILDFEESEKYLSKAYAMNPGSETIRYHLGFLNEKKGVYEDAIKYYKEALEIDPSYTLCDRHINVCRAKILLSSALSDHRRGAYEEAIKKYRESIQLNPEDREAVNKMKIAVKQNINKCISEVKEYIQNHKLLEAEKLLSKLMDEYPGDSDVKDMYYKLAESTHQQDINRQIILNRERERDESLILITALEILRDKSVAAENKLNLITGELSKLSEQQQLKILESLRMIEASANDVGKRLDQLLCTELDRINCTSSCFIPALIETNIPVDLWLTVDLNSKIKQVVKKYNRWVEGIPTVIKYDLTSNLLTQASGLIPVKAILLIDKKADGPAAYQIWLSSEGQLLLLKASSYTETRNLPNTIIGEWIFTPEKAALHNRLIQLHRYEIKTVIDGLIEKSTS
ncbi:MAG: tetratricopeptide repeat protein [Candidatus Odinarchaeota archaeon]